MRGRTRTLIGTLTLVVAAGATATALAVTPPAGTFSGQSKQKRPVSLTTNSSGRVTHFEISWRAKCEKPHKYWTGSTQINNSNGLKGDGDHFHSGGNYTASAGGGITGKVNASVKGHFPDATHAKGKWHAKVKVYNSKGKQIDTCKRNTKWKASSS